MTRAMSMPMLLSRLYMLLWIISKIKDSLIVLIVYRRGTYVLSSSGIFNSGY